MISFDEFTKKKKKPSAVGKSFEDFMREVNSDNDNEVGSFEDFSKSINFNASGMSFDEFVRKAKGLDDDLAPVRSTVGKLSDESDKKKDEEKSEKKTEEKSGERTWFQKSESDSVIKTILGSGADLLENVGTGIIGMGEKAVDALMYLSPAFNAGQQAQNNPYYRFDIEEYRQQQEASREFVEKDLYDEEKVAKFLISDQAKKVGIDAEKDSVFGEKSDTLAQSAGQLGATIALSPVLPWYMTTGLTSFGSEAEGALKEGAGYEMAGLSATVTAGADILTEKLFGGSGLGEKGIINLDKVTQGMLTKTIAQKVTRKALEFGVDVVGEGSEEVVSGIISNLGTALYKEENVKDILFSEEALDEYLESFIGGAVLGGGMNSVKLGKSIANDTDYRVERTQNEQKVFDTELQKRIAEEETDGKKLSKRERAEIEKQVERDLERGYIDLDTIESTLGGDTYSEYKSILDREESMQNEFDTLNKMKQGEMTGEQVDRRTELKSKLEELKNNSKRTELKDKLSLEVKELVKYDRLSESYNEKTRRSEKFTVELSKYDEKQQAVVKKAVESGILNNTNRTHEFVDMIAKISADKGVSFDFTNNAKLKESGFALEGKTINGYVKDGNIALNIDSKKALNTVVGHEITHVLEGTDLYTELQKVVKEYATTKGEYNTRLEEIKELYKGVKDANIEQELTAELIGDYLFTDSDFVSRLSVEKPNVFKKIYDEIKYLVKTVTGGKEARQLAKLQKTFENVYRSSATNKNTESVDYDLDVKEDIEINYVSLISKPDMAKTEVTTTLEDVKNKDGRTIAREAREKLPKNEKDVISIQNKDTGNDIIVGLKAIEHGLRRNSEYNAIVSMHLESYLENAIKINEAVADANRTHDSDIYLGYGETANGEKIPAYFVVSKLTTGQEELIEFNSLYSFNAKKIAEDSTQGGASFQARTSANISITELLDNVNEVFSDVLPKSVAEHYGHERRDTKIGNSVKYSLSKDTKGGQLSDMQIEYFKDSAIRDDNGNLKVMYHGSPASFSIFDKKKAKSSGYYGSGFYFSESESHAGQYGSKYEVYLNIKNPMQSGTNSITKEQLRKFVDAVAENEDYGIENYGYGATVDSVTEDVYGKDDFAMITDINATAIGDMVEAIQLFNEVNGTNYDGIIVPTETVAFYPEQIKAVTNENPTDNPDINMSLSEGGRNVAPTRGWNVYGKDIALEAPVQESLETSDVKTSDKASDNVVDEYAPLTEAEANERDAQQADRINTLDEAPPETEAPYYGEEEPVEVKDPFEDRDIREVGDRKQKAYMYENPEVKPFFQEEAKLMLGELRRSIKGQRTFNDQVYYDTNGESGWFGTTRETSEEIAYLLDEFKYTYADIEKGLKAIIEDNGKENNAISKRIEFMLDERLREGHTDFETDTDIPANEEYINLLREKQIVDYSDEAFEMWARSLAETEPADTTEMMDDIAPLDEVQVLYSLEAEQQEKVAEVDNAVEAEETTDTPEFSVNESYNAKLENYRTAIEGYKTAKSTIETAFNEAINKKTAEYNSLKRKDTNRASNLLTQIENLKLRKSNNVTTLDSKIARVEGIVENMVQNEASWKQKKLASRRVDYHRGIVDNIKNAFKSKGFDFDKVLESAKNKGTFASVDNTPQRFIEKSLGYKEGQILNDLTVNKVAQNESKGIKWLNSYTDKKSGLLAKIAKEYGIKPRSKESASAQMYAEGFWVDDDGNFIKYRDAELAMDYPDAKVRDNIKKLAKDPRIRQIYDETLDMINASRKRNLYPEIPRRNNYFLHFREMDDTFSKLGIPFNPNDIRLKDLPTDINGMTADLQPGQPYFASSKQRMGYKTTYDLVGGVERYLNSAKNQIYHIDDIQTLRALRNYIADTYGQAHGLEALDTLTEEEASQRIEEVYNSHLSTFAKFLNEEANVLAGKTSLTDRGLEGVIGRRGIQFLDTVNRQVGSNMVGFNVSSALTNTVSAVQAFAKSNKFDATKALAQTVSNKIGSIFGKTDGFAENNPMLIRRKGIERLTRTPWESVTDKGYLLMSAIDNVSSEFIVRTKFNELTRKGMSEQQAHVEADKWASRILGDRSLGQQPQLYNSKMLGLLTKFQLEVRNQLDSQFYDTIQEAKVTNEDINNALVRNAKTSAKIGATFFQLAVLQHLFGKAFESVAGYNPAFDIVEVLVQMFGFDDDEESEDTVLDNLEQGFLTLLGDLPYTSTFTGGRIPISTALPVEQFVTGKDSYGNEKSRVDTLVETAPYYLLPGGYGQIKKTTQGLGMFSDEHPVAGSYTDSGNLRFPIEDTIGNRVRSAVFGQYASEEARDYFDNERSPLKEKQIQEYKDLELPIREYWDYREGLSKQDKLEDKFDYIAGLDLPVEKKNIMINNIVDRKEAVDLTNYDDFDTYEEFDFATKNPEKYEFLQLNNISYKAYSANEVTKETYNWYYNNPDNLLLAKAVSGDLMSYRNYSKALNKLEADKDENGKSINGSRKEKVLNYINSLDADYGEKIILYKNEYKSDDTYNYEIIEYLDSRADIAYEEEVEILKKLGFTVDADGTVRW